MKRKRDFIEDSSTEDENLMDSLFDRESDTTEDLFNSTDSTIFDWTDEEQDNTDNLNTNDETDERNSESPIIAPQDDDLMNLYKNTIMFKNSNLSIWQVFTAVMAIVIRFNLSDQAHQAILELIKFIAGPDFKFLDTSKYLMNKLFNPLNDAAKYIYYCTTCNVTISTQIPVNKSMRFEVKCQQCQKKYQTTKKDGNFFVTLDLKSQLHHILSNQYLQNEIDKNIDNNFDANVGNGINDVYDSERYRNDEFIQSKNSIGEKVLTLNVNLDGAPLFKSGKNSFWPIQCIINEIPQVIRHKFMLLAGLWYTSTEPKPQFMNLYLSTFIKQIQNLTKKGLKVVNIDNTLTTYFVKIFCFPVDSVARPVLQNRLQFNGFHGCSWCYQRGIHNSGSMKYPVTPEIPQQRDHCNYLKDVEKHKKDIKKIRKTKKNEKYTVNGIKGPSVLSSLPNFDCIWGFPHDYMHAVLLGVTRQLWNRWSKNFLTANQKKLINARLTNIRPTNEIHRTPQMLLKKRTWKATEWRSWLLFYSVPVLSGILREDLLDSYKLLVKSIYKLLSVNLGEDQLLTCEIDLLNFVCDCQKFYQVSFITFNVHSLLHIVESVRKNGPSWATSTYAFENNIYNLKRKVSGPNEVLNQMANRTLRYNNFQRMIYDEANISCREFYKKIIDKRQSNACNFVKSKDGALMMDIVNQSSTGSISYYSRCLINSKMYHSQMYNKAKKTNNSFMKLMDGRMAQIMRFLIKDNSAFVEACILDVEMMEQCNHLWTIMERANETIILPVTMINSKMIYISIKALTSNERNQNYLTQQPNDFEVQ
ncbi:uncharacterized protein LOC130670022 [Microplitis mediator]|uniref:uncharacterized protein LOC130670022 n=1 Tax=Microplitis mediator TaxID=375433 RepID=UPI0025551BEC|nr:uncharacterized protein LOC130670022 [Microplitis mediator]